LAAIPLLFAWRSQFGYFFYVDIISLAYIMVHDRSAQEAITPDSNPSNNGTVGTLTDCSKVVAIFSLGSW